MPRLLVNWSTVALLRLEEQFQDMKSHDGNENRARRTKDAIVKAAGSLDELSHRGVKGREPGTLELIMHKYPYIIVYAVTDVVDIITIKCTTLDEIGRQLD